MGAIIVIASSAGGLKPLKRIVEALPPNFRASVFVVQHIGANPSVLPDILSRRGSLPATFGRHGEGIEHGHIYVAPPDYHMRLGFGAILLDHGIKVHFTRPAADPLFVSAAEAYGKRVIGIVLSGGNSDGAEGMRAITARGGLGLVQDLAEAECPEMPHAALRLDHPEPPLTADQIAERIVAHCPCAD
ncbi:chemotaxis protein CheB [Methylobacterium sp. J-030]|uniref:chemotaxis protein CheB n=1 Tax=Methylobacterium sp. J-030 TaxID=2836627 RepID=UPI001FBAA14A|nr:chemotaxis protein CheB [Methylobacterium sp. J-030]MCJ2067671.1 chemotaxis protein CheB [Methylobacterium sp. J-030]